MYVGKSKYLIIWNIYIRDEDTDVMNQCNYHKEIFQPKTLTCMASPYQIGTNCTGLSLTPITIGNISKSFALIDLFLKTARILK